MAAEITKFNAPQNGMIGFATAFMNVNGRDKRIAHAYLMDGEPVIVSIGAPASNMTLAKVREFASELMAFADAVEKA
jgi:hypothetical protein